MNILCAIFGHKPPSYDRKAGGSYCRIINHGEDGIGRKHGAVWGQCPRCDKGYRVCNVHQHRDEYAPTQAAAKEGE